MSKEIMTVEEVAAYLNLAPTTIYKKVEAREIPYAKIGNLLRFPKDAIDRWIAQNTRPPRESLFDEFARLHSKYHFKKWLESKGVKPEGLTDQQLLELVKKAIKELQEGDDGPQIQDDEKPVTRLNWIERKEPQKRKASAKKAPKGKSQGPRQKKA